jgi:hypothetical protein
MRKQAKDGPLRRISQRLLPVLRGLFHLELAETPDFLGFLPREWLQPFNLVQIEYPCRNEHI